MSLVRSSGFLHSSVSQGDIKDQAELIIEETNSSGCLSKQMTELTKEKLQNPAIFMDFGNLSRNPKELDMEDDLEKDLPEHLEDIGTKSTKVNDD